MSDITEHSVETGSHTTAYLAAGPEDGPLVIFVHGWPELSLSWRNQLPALAALGFRCVAPDMRGYGRSSVYDEIEAYSLENIVADMIGLLDALDREKAVWVGHDWGSPVVWSIASHHPGRCEAITSLCVPYTPVGSELFELVDRSIYPEDEFPMGQWEYIGFYAENFTKATADFEANVYNTVKGLFRKGDPAGFGKPASTAYVRQAGGFFGDLKGADGPLAGLPHASDLDLDTDVISEEEAQIYVESLERNGFFGPDAWYVNFEANDAYAQSAHDLGRLAMPVLFIGAMYDYTCETINSRAKEPMISHCANLTLEVIKSGHWMAQEKPVEVNAVLTKWLARQVPNVWPEPK